MNIRQIFLSSLRLYFAPLVGAVRAVRDEFRRFDQQHRSHVG
jgi:hypothetical protein